MMARRRIVLPVLLLASLAVSVLTLHLLYAIRPAATLEEVLYVPSPKILKQMSLGYNTLLADIYWTRAVQYFGSHHQRIDMEYRLLQPLLDIATSLDPHLLPAYDFGSIFLAEQPPQGAGNPIGAIQLLKRGIQNNPGEWRLYQDIGFIYYMELKDYKRAGEAFAQAAQIPGAHPFLKVLAARTLSMGGDDVTSEMLWQSVYESTRDKSIRDNAIKHLRALIVDQEITRLQRVVQLYRRRTGQFPTSFAGLVQQHYLAALPRDPLEHPYLLKPDGTIEVEDYKLLPFITKGLPPGIQPSNIDLSARKPQS